MLAECTNPACPCSLLSGLSVGLALGVSAAAQAHPKLCCGTREDHPRTRECSPAGLEGDSAQAAGAGVSNKKMGMTVPSTAAAAAAELPGHHQLLTGACVAPTALFLTPESVPGQERRTLNPISSPQLETVACALINTPP